MIRRRRPQFDGTPGDIPTDIDEALEQITEHIPASGTPNFAAIRQIIASFRNTSIQANMRGTMQMLLAMIDTEDEGWPAELDVSRLGIRKSKKKRKIDSIN